MLGLPLLSPSPISPPARAPNESAPGPSDRKRRRGRGRERERESSAGPLPAEAGGGPGLRRPARLPLVITSCLADAMGERAAGGPCENESTDAMALHPVLPPQTYGSVFGRVPTPPHHELQGVMGRFAPVPPAAQGRARVPVEEPRLHSARDPCCVPGGRGQGGRSGRGCARAGQDCRGPALPVPARGDLQAGFRVPAALKCILQMPSLVRGAAPGLACASRRLSGLRAANRVARVASPRSAAGAAGVLFLPLMMHTFLMLSLGGAVVRDLPETISSYS